MTLILRSHENGATVSQAVYSRCETYRYALTRTWGPGRRLAFVMLNPSKATERANDPTVERCERRARRLGYGAMRVCNIFALRETDPRLLRRHAAPEGVDNTAQIRAAALWADDILCAWGIHGAHLDQGRRTALALADHATKFLALGTTKDGHPRHPLYCGYAMLPQPWGGYALRAGAN